MANTLTQYNFAKSSTCRIVANVSRMCGQTIQTRVGCFKKVNVVWHDVFCDGGTL